MLVGSFQEKQNLVFVYVEEEEKKLDISRDRETDRGEE